MRAVPVGLSLSPPPSPSSSLPPVTAQIPINLLKTSCDSPARVKFFQRCAPRFSDTESASRADFGCLTTFISMPFLSCQKSENRHSFHITNAHFNYVGSYIGVCRASQAVDLFPSICPEIVIRDARVEDCWEVADTHCSSFFPDYTFPVDLVLRIDRFIALLSGFSVPPGCMRTCLVAVSGASGNDNLYIGSKDFKIGGFEEKFSFGRGSVAGILTVDTVADYLPRKGPFRQRRTGIAYISNVAVRKADRRKGIAKLLLAKAEARALSWGCRSIALHCDVNNAAATRLYNRQGFKVINLAENVRWPQPKTSRNLRLYFMMKLLTSNGTI